MHNASVQKSLSVRIFPSLVSLALFLNGDGAQHQLGLAPLSFFLRLVRVGVLFELIQADAHLSIHLSPDCLLSKLPI